MTSPASQHPTTGRLNLSVTEPPVTTLYYITTFYATRLTNQHMGLYYITTDLTLKSEICDGSCHAVTPFNHWCNP